MASLWMCLENIFWWLYSVYNAAYSIWMDFFFVCCTSQCAVHSYVPEEVALQLCVCAPHLRRGVTVPTLLTFSLALKWFFQGWLFWTDLQCSFVWFWLSMDIWWWFSFPFPLPSVDIGFFCGRFDQHCHVHELHLKLNKSSCSKSMYF